ncbi:hypothetical protein EDB98_1027 [Pseudomonas fluorescens]|jgi:hypothetical protein|nr:hypothetical protein EDB98_1027 [Pseudomonas fluorescens]SFW70438.1 hypothetical protein SAMN03159439_03856 [Pseudomonas sp. NFACC04-2]
MEKEEALSGYLDWVHSYSQVLEDFLQVVAMLVNLSGLGLTASLGLSLKKR